MNVLVMAKAPVPGRVKTRLCPPCTPEQAASVAAAALADTLAAVGTGTLVLSGRYDAPAGWGVVPQRGDGLGERLRHAFVDAGTTSLLVGMDTPQVTSALLDEAAATLRTDGVDAVLGPAADGGWWTLGLRDPYHADVLVDVPMSTDRTGELTLAALLHRELRVVVLPTLRDVDTADDAHAVARECAAGSAFARAVAAHVPTGVRA
ncbi:hypothetical protein Voc01_079930 [Virgisporangium ochraceum]|uniref:Glycosyltransferase n=2 Tax=Virgisporangium ochraceum TaxID=65505 RepID=A0A8J4EFU4_9ACTN|nr:DUF2064 domain-containing protein [Virgisporangium ochraceum]GIJ73076.1 hypothetical protein Voc01_079930 [Virgisporangium ochraceum]